MSRWWSIKLLKTKSWLSKTKLQSPKNQKQPLKTSLQLKRGLNNRSSNLQRKKNKLKLRSQRPLAILTHSSSPMT